MTTTNRARSFADFGTFYRDKRLQGHAIMWLLGIGLLTSCSAPLPSEPNGGLFLPDGFEAVVVVDELEGQARQIAVDQKGDIYVKLRRTFEDGSCAALRDTDGDGRADIIKRFGDTDYQGNYGYQTAMQLYQGYIYYSTELAVYRIKMDPDELLPVGERELVVDDHADGDHEHNGKPISFDDEGNMYVPFGAPSNACQEPKRTPGQPGLDPCPQLEDHAGIWRFDAHKINQTQKDGYHYATGIRSVVAMDWNHQDNQLYIVMHGRDDLLRLFPEHFSPWESAMLPSEEFMRVTEGSDFGWPYCYYDQLQEKKVLAPEYGGDGDSIGRCADFDLPEIGFPGHWAPNGLHFYQGDQFPERYKNGAFLAFHGSTIRAPYPQSGYFVGFAPFENGRPTGEWEIFADGFAGVDTIVNTNDAIYRPMGITEGPDGSLYLSETEKGKIWRVQYKGDGIREFGEPQLAAMERRKQLPHIKTPDRIRDNLQKTIGTDGEALYLMYCANCHQKNGKGAPGRYPTLRETDWVTGDKGRLIDVIMNGLEGGIEVNGEPFNSLMPQHAYLSDEEIAMVATYVRQSFGNEASEVTEQEVAQVRQASNSQAK
jgi:glucose/arabinose dehydrogenase/mono/diheme cytochrome c family protein